MSSTMPLCEMLVSTSMLGLSGTGRSVPAVWEQKLEDICRTPSWSLSFFNNSRHKYVHVFTDGAGRRGSGLNLLKGFDGRMEAKIMRDKLLIRGRVCCCACRFQHLLRESGHHMIVHTILYCRHISWKQFVLVSTCDLRLCCLVHASWGVEKVQWVITLNPIARWLSWMMLSGSQGKRPTDLCTCPTWDGLSCSKIPAKRPTSDYWMYWRCVIQHVIYDDKDVYL